MNEQFERINEILEMQSTDQKKIEFLLRQVDWLTQVNAAYKNQISTNQQKDERVKDFLLRANQCYVNNEDILVNTNIIMALGEFGIHK